MRTSEALAMEFGRWFFRSCTELLWNPRRFSNARKMEKMTFAIFIRAYADLDLLGEEGAGETHLHVTWRSPRTRDATALPLAAPVNIPPRHSLHVGLALLPHHVCKYGPQLINGD